MFITPVSTAGGRGGDRSARLYVITDGTAEVRVHETKVDEIGPGDYFGEMAVIDGLPRAATVTATSPVSALTLADFNVKALLRSMPDLGLKMLRTACARIRALESQPIICRGNPGPMTGACPGLTVLRGPDSPAHGAP